MEIHGRADCGVHGFHAFFVLLLAARRKGAKIEEVIQRQLHVGSILQLFPANLLRKPI